MPFYKIAEMSGKHEGINPLIESRTAVGEFMKVGIVTKPEGEGPPLHEHPNEEQFTLVMSGQMHFVLGDEDHEVDHPHPVIEAGMPGDHLHHLVVEPLEPGDQLPAGRAQPRAEVPGGAPVELRLAHAPGLEAGRRQLRPTRLEVVQARRPQALDLQQVPDVLEHRPRGAVARRQRLRRDPPQPVLDPGRRAAQPLQHVGEHLDRHQGVEVALEPWRAGSHARLDGLPPGPFPSADRGEPS